MHFHEHAFLFLVMALSWACHHRMRLRSPKDVTKTIREMGRWLCGTLMFSWAKLFTIWILHQEAGYQIKPRRPLTHQPLDRASSRRGPLDCGSVSLSRTFSYHGPVVVTSTRARHSTSSGHLADTAAAKPTSAQAPHPPRHRRAPLWPSPPSSSQARPLGPGRGQHGGSRDWVIWYSDPLAKKYGTLILSLICFDLKAIALAHLAAPASTWAPIILVQKIFNWNALYVFDGMRTRSIHHCTHDCSWKRYAQGHH
jgi:hypothetical protein